MLLGSALSKACVINNEKMIIFIHSTPEEFENGALILRLGLTSTPANLHENGAFRKRSLHRRNLKTPALRFILDEAFRKRVVLKHKSKMTSDCCVFKFLRGNVNGALVEQTVFGSSFSN